MNLIGKLQDGTVFIKKGHDGVDPFDFKADEGIQIIKSFVCFLLFHVVYMFF